jgi:hypothetical protein
MLARYGLLIADSANVLRFLGKIDADAPLPSRLNGEAHSDRRRRYEGVRVKHWYRRNCLKAYNKAGNVFRVETGINHTRSFKVFRQAHDDPRQPMRWQPMRKGVADLHLDQRKRLTARVSRLPRLLRSHGLIRKTPRTHCYQLTAKGREVATLVRAAASVTTQQLMKIAA